MQIWVGLGNPGAQYALHRHNVGFMALDLIAEDRHFTPWKKQFQGWTCEGRIGNEKIILLKPGTFMNNSGQSVGEAMRFYKLTPADVTLFHNGLRSTDQHIGPEFRRVRIGIGHPGHKDRVTGYVLGNYAKAEIEPLTDMLADISREADWLAAGDNARFMSEYALRMGND
jgi:PTH1 family peptidyl-tRNA hydrolase